MGAFAEERTAGAGLEIERFDCQTQDHLNTEKSPPSSSLLGHSKSGQSSYPSVVELVEGWVKEVPDQMSVVSAVKEVPGEKVVPAHCATGADSTLSVMLP